VRILVVEDDALLGDAIQAGLRQQGFVADWVRDGVAADLALESGTHDAVVLDIGLPRRSGLEVLARLRGRKDKVPVLILTARDTVEDRIAGLDAGADDYLVKPFAFDELLARLRALTRRGRTRQLDTVLSYGPVVLDTTSHVAHAAGRVLDLSATEYRLLEHLLRHAEAIVSRDQLAEHVWGGEYDPFSNVADVYVGYLRRKLRAAGLDEPLIHTVRGMGYMLKARGPDGGRT
jgi:DNA-binding response OmpR family regulator